MILWSFPLWWNQLFVRTYLVYVSLKVDLLFKCRRESFSCVFQVFTLLATNRLAGVALRRESEESIAHGRQSTQARGSTLALKLLAVKSSPCQLSVGKLIFNHTENQFFYIFIRHIYVVVKEFDKYEIIRWYKGTCPSRNIR